MERSYSVKDLAKLWQVNEGAIRHWLSQGRIEFFKIGVKTTRIKESEALAFLENCKYE